VKLASNSSVVFNLFFEWSKQNSFELALRVSRRWSFQFPSWLVKSAAGTVATTAALECVNCCPQCKDGKKMCNPCFGSGD